VPYQIRTGVFYYDWLMVYGGIFPTFPEPEHGKMWLRPWDFKVVKDSPQEMVVAMSVKDDFTYDGHPRPYRNGETGIEATLAKLRDLFSMRDPLYRATAAFVIETGKPSVTTLVNLILMQLELAGVVPAEDVPSSVSEATPRR